MNKASFGVPLVATRRPMLLAEVSICVVPSEKPFVHVREPAPLLIASAKYDCPFTLSLYEPGSIPIPTPPELLMDKSSLALLLPGANRLIEKRSLIESSIANH